MPLTKGVKKTTKKGTKKKQVAERQAEAEIDPEEEARIEKEELEVTCIVEAASAKRLRCKLGLVPQDVIGLYAFEFLEVYLVFSARRTSTPGFSLMSS